MYQFQIQTTTTKQGIILKPKQTQIDKIYCRLNSSFISLSKSSSFMMDSGWQKKKALNKILLTRLLLHQLNY